MAEQLKVFVSIAPQKFLVEKIAGDTVSVEVMLQAGHSPELYEPLPKQLAALEKADIYFKIGVPFEKHWQKQLQKNPALSVVNSSLDLRSSRASDPHVWTNPLYVVKIAQVIRDRLQQLSPAHELLYAENYTELEHELESLHHSIKTQFKNLSTVDFFVVHPSWGHFAQAYGLQQHALEKNHGHIGPRGIVKLVQLARQEQVTILFSQQQYHLASATAFAREINADIVMLDPLAEDYINNMQHVVSQFVKALK